MIPFIVGSVRVDPPVLLAPMEDVTNLPFRLIAKRIANPGLMFTEFVSAMAVHHNAKKTLKKLRVEASERPLAVQVFGAEPEIVAEGARLAEAMGADIVDVNMGCWVPKVCKTGSGAALLKDPDAAERIVVAVVKAVRLPVSVKVRAGWDYGCFAAPELARRFEAAGAAMLTLHARFAKQGYEGEADWRLIGDLREAVSIPLIGNGDVKTPEDAMRMFRETGCDGVMIGRATISNPWALARISAAVGGRPEPAEPTLRERVETALQHLALMVMYEAETIGETGADATADNLRFARNADPTAEGRACRALRGQIPMYIKGFPGAAELRRRLTSLSTFMEFHDNLVAYLEGQSSL